MRTTLPSICASVSAVSYTLARAASLGNDDVIGGAAAQDPWLILCGIGRFTMATVGGAAPHPLASCEIVG